jgi:hypothetical protein
MSLFKLFLSGLLVAGGLILGAFTLHGYLDPQWAQRQAQAASVKPPEPAPDASSVNAFQDRSKFVARSEPPPPVVKAPAVAPPVVKASARPDAADAKAAAKPAPKKKDAERPAADKAKAAPPPQPPPQQASFDWLKQLFGKN